MEFINIAHAGVITDAPTLASSGMKILNFLLSVFGIIAIIMAVVSGMLYFFSAGDEEVNKKAKKSVVYSVIGVVLAMAALVVVKVVGQFLK